MKNKYLILGILIVILGIVSWRFLKKYSSCGPIPPHIQLSVLAGALERFNVDCNRYPTEDEGLVILISNSGVEGWRGPYLPGWEVIKDPWGASYYYYLDGAIPKVISSGRDKIFNTDDDLFYPEIK